jgi:hypothetical protein
MTDLFLGGPLQGQQKIFFIDVQVFGFGRAVCWTILTQAPRSCAQTNGYALNSEMEMQSTENRSVRI